MSDPKHPDDAIPGRRDDRIARQLLGDDVAAIGDRQTVDTDLAPPVDHSFVTELPPPADLIVDAIPPGTTPVQEELNAVLDDDVFRKRANRLVRQPKFDKHVHERFMAYGGDVSDGVTNYEASQLVLAEALFAILDVLTSETVTDPSK